MSSKSPLLLAVRGPFKGVQSSRSLMWAFGLATSLLFSQRVSAAAIDDIKLEISRETCAELGANSNSFLVYATNASVDHSVDANFKYDSVPAQQRFILFDANLHPITERYPKYQARRLGPRETAPIGCSSTHRAAMQAPGPLTVPLVITKQSASYTEPNAPEVPAEDARSFAAFYLQGVTDACAQGAMPPGLLYLVNLHPYARLSVSMHGESVNLAPMSTTEAGCSNGASNPQPIAEATLGVTPGVISSQPAAVPDAKPRLSAPAAREPQGSEAAPLILAPLSLGTTLQTQIVCATSVPPGWIKINDAWNPTVCGKPTLISYNVWIIQQITDQPLGAIIHACKGAVPPGWAIVGTLWNPTVCGHPTANQSNVMAIERLN